MTITASQDYFKEFVPLNYFKGIICEAVYTYQEKTHSNSYLVNQFPGLYHPEATIIWAHKDIALITLIAAEICKNLFQWRLKVVDCFRPVDAQINMAKYGFHPSLVSPPGAGAHPRGMAIDIVPEVKIDDCWHPVEMGTEFDYFAMNPLEVNPAARHYVEFSNKEDYNWKLCQNRYQLEYAMRQAAAKSGLPLYPLCQEWWDFRLPESIYQNFAPLYEKDIPAYMRMLSPDIELLNLIKNEHYPNHIIKLCQAIKESLSCMYS